VPQPKAQRNRDGAGAEVLTLAEAAAYLRVREEAVRELIEKGALPAQRVGGEWRLLKRAVVEWLQFEAQPPRELQMFPPPWALDHPFWEDLFRVLEQRILSKLPLPERPVAKPGSKQAVLKHFGVFKDDADVEEQLADLRARRGAAGG